MALICIIYVQIQLLGAAVVQNHAKISKSHDNKICILYKVCKVCLYWSQFDIEFGV